MSEEMKDRFGRTITYLRLSVTDRCDLRCIYCMGEEGVPLKEHSDILSIEEFLAIAEAAVECGVTKIRITGGEPLLRKGLLDLCRGLKMLPGLRELALTTNGRALPKMAKDLKEAGVDRINLSLDTLDPEKYKKITRTGDLDDALSGLWAAKEAGFSDLKINTVLMGGVNDDEIGDLAELTRDHEITVRFIELMPIGECINWPKERFLSADAVLRALPDLIPVSFDGVAERYRLPDHKGTVGLIRPVSCRFCDRCNRLRVTADGRLKPCLHSRDEIPIRGLFGKELREAIRRAAFVKPKRHYLVEEERSGSERGMSRIGG